MRFRDLSGERFGRLTVQELDHRNERGQAFWRCRCDCGVEKVTQGHKLTSGDTQSCGCLHRERARAAGGQNRTHGLSQGNRAYKAWQSIKERCLNPRSRLYPKWGGRGIWVCDRWANSFEAFLADMGECGPGMSVERIDNDGPYAPENCKWATRSEQQRNKSTTVRFTYQGRTQSLSDWADELGIDSQTLWGRYRAGWSVERILTQGSNKKLYRLGSKEQTLSEWASELGVTKSTLEGRLKAGWTLERVLSTPARPYRKGSRGRMQT